MAADKEVLNEKKEDEVDQNATDTSEESQECVPSGLVVKHPLQNVWTLWFFTSKVEHGKSWEDGLMEIASFDTVEDFWSLYNHIELASKLKIGCDYSLFKKGVKPMWEDQVNIRGGRWLINLNKQQRATDLDAFWMELLLMLIGETFEEVSDEVCGAVVNIRGRVDKIGVWTRDCNNANSIIKIGQKVKETLRIPQKITIGFQSHKDAASKRGSSIRCLYEV